MSMHTYIGIYIYIYIYICICMCFVSPPPAKTAQSSPPPLLFCLGVGYAFHGFALGYAARLAQRGIACLALLVHK